MARIEALEDATPLLHDGAALRACAQQRGHLFFRQLLSRAVVLQLRRVVLQACARRAWLAPQAPRASATPAPGVRLGAYDAPWLDLQYELGSVAEFIHFEWQAPLRAAAQQVLGGPVASGSTVACRIMSPHAPELTTPPHQDRFYFPHAETMWTAWVPLGDVAPEEGGLAVLEASHRLGLLPHAHRGAGVYGAQLRSRRPWLTSTFRAGDVLLFHGLTVHRAFDNLSPALRISIDLRYVPAEGAPT